MQTRISYKLFAGNMSIILILTLTCIYLFSRMSHTMISGAINGIDEEVMKKLSLNLGSHYSETQSWDEFTSQKDAWDNLVNQHFLSTFFELMEKAKSRMHNKGNMDTPHIGPNNKAADVWSFPFGTFLQRVSLLDADKNFIIKAEILKTDLNYQPIEYKNKTIAYLSVGKINLYALPLGEYFLKQQLSTLYWIMICGGILTIFVSFMLSYHITSPITKLVQGVNEIAKRNYGHTTEVKTNDELATLASGLNIASNQLSTFDNQRKQWLLDISHELRTPLTIAISETSAICDKLTKCDIPAVEAIREDLIQMKRLVDDLHDISKIDEVGITVHKESTELTSLLETQSNYYSKVFAQQNITLINEISARAINLEADKNRIIQVVRIILENCMRHMQTPGTVWLRCIETTQDIILTIEDSGLGVPDDALDKLFDRLYRTDTSRNRSTGGAGLGLSICHEIIAAHNASIRALHSIHGGLRIEITFPKYCTELT